MSHSNLKFLFASSVIVPLGLGVATGLARGAVTFPPMRAGFWQNSTVIHMNMAGQAPDNNNKARTSYICENAEVHAATMKLMNGAMNGCKFDIEGGGGRYTMTTSCTNPNGLTGTITGSGTITIVGDSAAHVVSQSVSDLGNMKMTMDLTSDSKWLGACPSGVAVGDRGIMVNGVFQKQGNVLAKPSR